MAQEAIASRKLAAFGGKGDKEGDTPQCFKYTATVSPACYACRAKTRYTKKTRACGCNVDPAWKCMPMGAPTIEVACAGACERCDDHE